MRTLMIALLLATLAPPVSAGTLIATRTLRAQTVLSAADIALSDDPVEGALSDPRDAIGLETRVAIYPGHPIREGDLAPPALVERNQTIMLVFQRGGLTIRAEGRALDRGAVGETIRVMNSTSKAVVSAVIGTDGSVYVLN